ncbi:MAG: hypothetical protein RLZZ622_956, partial [Planctomycetota bacterium]
NARGASENVAQNGAERPGDTAIFDSDETLATPEPVPDAIFWQPLPSRPVVGYDL